MERFQQDPGRSLLVEEVKDIRQGVSHVFRTEVAGCSGFALFGGIFRRALPSQCTYPKPRSKPTPSFVTSNRRDDGINVTDSFDYMRPLFGTSRAPTSTIRIRIGGYVGVFLDHRTASWTQFYVGQSSRGFITNTWRISPTTAAKAYITTCYGSVMGIERQIFYAFGPSHPMFVGMII